MTDSQQLWVQAQQRTFLRWVNMKLTDASSPTLDDLHALCTSTAFYDLLSCLSKTRIDPLHTKPTTRFQQTENIDKALKFIREHENLQMYNIGAEDLVDGNDKLLMGLVWTLILAYSIDETEQEDPGLSKRDILLRWAQLASQGVKIVNFTDSWNDGLALAAILAKYEPDRIDFDAVKTLTSTKRIAQVLTLAESIGIPRLIDVDDLAVPKPDEKSVIAYVSIWFNKFRGRDLQLAPTSKQPTSKQLKARAETFIAIVSNIVAMKQKYLAGMESLIVEMANWMAQLSFSPDEFHNIEDVLRFRKNVLGYRRQGKMDLFKALTSLKSLKVKMNSCLRDYNFDPFKEPYEKSIDKCNKLLNELNSLEVEAQQFVNEYFAAKLHEMGVAFQKNASSIQIGLNLIESEMAEQFPSMQTEVNSLSEVMEDLQSLQMMTARLGTTVKEIEGLCSRIDRPYDTFESSLKVAKFKAKISHMHSLAVDRLQFIDRELQSKEKAMRQLREAIEPENQAARAAPNGSMQLEKFVFDKFDQGQKDYLNKAEFKEAFGYLYPGVSSKQLDELFEIIYNSSDTILRGVKFADFARLLGSVEEKQPVAKKSTADYSKLANMSGQFYRDTFQELSANRDFLTVNDLKRADIDQRLIDQIGNVLLGVDGNQSYDYKAFFDNNDNSLVYQDQNHDDVTPGLDNVLQDLEKIDLSTV